MLTPDARTTAIELSYVLGPEDWAEFFAYHHKHSPRVRRSLAMSQFLLAAIFLGMALMAGFPRAGGWPWLVLAVVWLVGLPPYYRWSTRRRVLKAAQGTSRGNLGRHRLIAGPEGVRDLTAFHEWRVIWPGIERVADAPEQVLLYAGRDSACIIPNRAFATPAAREEFLVTVEEWRQLGGGSSPLETP